MAHQYRWVENTFTATTPNGDRLEMDVDAWPDGKRLVVCVLDDQEDGGRIALTMEQVAHLRSWLETVLESKEAAHPEG